MGLADWMRQKSEKKSVANIQEDLGPLIEASVDATRFRATPGDVRAVMAADRLKSLQRKLVEDVAIWSGLPLERAFSEVILPVLQSMRKHPYYETVVIAVYTPVQSLAPAAHVDLRPITPADILEIVDANWMALGVDPLHPFG